MWTRTIAGAKFVGTISLGLLTGISYTHNHLTLPTLLTLPSAPLANNALTHLRTLTAPHAQALAALASGSFFLAYSLSPSRGRHPYLLWVSLLTGAGSCAVDWFVVSGAKKSAVKEREGLVGTAPVGSDEDSEDYGAGSGEEDVEAGVNGEEVRGEVERVRRLEGYRSGVVGLSFIMGVVGIWGDAF